MKQAHKSHPDIPVQSPVPPLFEGLIDSKGDTGSDVVEEPKGQCMKEGVRPVPWPSRLSRQLNAGFPNGLTQKRDNLLKKVQEEVARQSFEHLPRVERTFPHPW